MLWTLPSLICNCADIVTTLPVGRDVVVSMLLFTVADVLVDVTDIL